MGCGGSKPEAALVPEGSTVTGDGRGSKVAPAPESGSDANSSLDIGNESSVSRISPKAGNSGKHKKGAERRFESDSKYIKRPTDATAKGSITRGIEERGYAVGDILGTGGFGEVRRAVRKEDGKQVAVKIISKLKFAGEEERRNMMMEMQLMQQCAGHPNVVELYEWLEDRWNFFYVVQLCTGGELMDRILALHHFSEKVAAHYFRQMLEGLQHVHSKLVVHRDLKPENFLFESSDADSRILLTDFGLSTAIPTPDAVMSDACGSAYYIAPEVFTRSYTKSADVFSMGVILFLLLSGTVPFGADAASEMDVYRAVQRDKLQFGDNWTNISGAAKELVSGLLEKNPAKRYSIAEALAHPWVSGEAASDVALDPSIVTSLQSFNAKNKFKRAAMKLIASALSAADIATLRASFHKIDKDGTGSISYGEMAQALKEMGFTDYAQVGHIIKNVDANGDGLISYEEFIGAVLERQLVHHQNTVWWAFCEYDLDGDGKVTLEELRAVMKHEPAAMVAQYLAEYDVNGDGAIDYDEFVRMLLPKDVRFKLSKTSAERAVKELEQEKAAAAAPAAAPAAAATPAPPPAPSAAT